MSLCRATFAAASLLCTYAVGAAGANLVTNPDFNTDLTGWTLQGGPGTFTLNNVDGLPSAPSAELAAPQSVFADAYSVCIAIAAPQSIDFYVNVKVTSGTGGTGGMQQYTDSNCTTAIGGAVLAGSSFVDGQGWSTFFMIDQPLATGTQSVQIVLQVAGTLPSPTGDASFDHVQFGPTTTPVRLQSFDVN